MDPIQYLSFKSKHILRSWVLKDNLANAILLAFISVWADIHDVVLRYKITIKLYYSGYVWSCMVYSLCSWARG
jgi:hypothetical protein